MNLSRQIAKRGIKVTFVNIQSVHQKIISAAKKYGEEEEEDNLVLTTIPYDRTPEDDPKHSSKQLDTLMSTMPGLLTDLIERINTSNPEQKISCVIADITIEWISEVAEKIGAEPVIFSPALAAAMALLLHLPMLLQQGNLDTNGTVTKGEVVSLSDDIPAWKANEFTWSFSGDLQIQKVFFECTKRISKAANQANWLLFNTCYEIESSACDLIPNLLPVGPLLLKENNLKPFSNYSCNLYPEDGSCLSWLDSKPVGSVVYVSFGSSVFFSQQQLDELALGLELSGRDFLWVVRSDIADGSRAVYPNGFLEKVSKLGKFVEWAPQVKVLSHPSTACFLSHCGWNSTLEGVSMGVPFLCWPYFSDQYHNQNYICDKWETGLRIEPDEYGIRSRDEIRRKIDMLFSEDNLKENALKLKEMCVKSVGEGGSSYMNFEIFIDHLKK